MDFIRLEYDFKEDPVFIKKLQEIINLCILSIDEKLSTGKDSDIILDKDYTLQTRFYSRLKEQGVAIVYKDSLTFNIYPTSVCITSSFKDLEAIELQTLKQVEENLKTEISLHINSILESIITLRKGVYQNEE